MYSSFFLFIYLFWGGGFRLLEEDDADMQSKVLDCLLNWKDDFLLPYDQHLKNLINSKSLREELTTWSLSRESDLVDTRHRAFLVPVVIRVLSPKVRKLKALASRKVFIKFIQFSLTSSIIAFCFLFFTFSSLFTISSIIR